MTSMLYGAGPRTGGAPVPDLVVDQLWRPAVSSGRVRLSTGRAADGWVEAERYLVVPSLQHPVMLLPDLDRPALRDAIRHYRRLRPLRAQVHRGALSAALATRVPLPVLSVQVSSGPEQVELPLDAIRAALGDDTLRASIGVRRGANRKATLQLVDLAGSPRGFAKVAWDETSAEGVLRETAALRRVRSTAGARVPDVLATGATAGRPFLVTAPLPADAQALRTSAPPPSAVELADLCPLVGRSAAGRTGHLAALRSRADRLPATAGTREVRSLIRDVLARVTSARVEVPVTTHWHGDLTPWNCARSGDGTLWVWDWESSEEHAVAGLDACHWAWTVRSEHGHRPRRDTVATVLVEVEPLLVALGLSRPGRAVVGAVWAVSVAERACSLAAARGEWDAGWVLPQELVSLVSGALDVLLTDRPGA